MATRLHYTLPIAREFARSARDRLRPGGLRSRLPPPGRPFVIVTGAGRSGTSAVARVLHESGVRMGEEFAQPSEYNPDGFYEDLAVSTLNDQIWRECGVRRLHHWPSRLTVLAVGSTRAPQMRALAARQGAGGWKDPRFALTLEAWLPHLPCPPKVIVCLRSPEAFVRSVTRIYGIVPREGAERRWVNTYRRLLDVIRDYGLEALCVEYERLVGEPEAVVGALAAFVGHPLDARYVEPSYRHFSYAVPAKYRAVYEAVRALAPLGGGGPTQAAAPEAVPAYLERVGALEETVGRARNAWLQESGSHPLIALRSAPSAGAGEAYAEALSEAQAALAALRPPGVLQRYHELTQAWVDRERLAVELVLQAARGQRTFDEARGAWRRFAAPETAAKAHRERTRELERALRSVGAPVTTSSRQ